MNNLYIYLFALFFLTTQFSALPAQAEEKFPDCYSNIDKFLHDTMPLASNRICMNQDYSEISKSDISNTLHNYIYADNVISMNSTISMLSKIEHANTTLIINGICAGDCSRILAPLADRIILMEGAFMALTDSSIPSRYMFFGTKIRDSNLLEGGVTLNEMKNLSEKHRIEKQEKFAQEVSLIASTSINLSHLQWHSQVRQTLKNNDTNCWPIRSLLIILTPAYLKENGFKIHGDKSPPLRSQILEIVKPLYEAPVVLYSYEQTPMESCK